MVSSMASYGLIETGRGRIATTDLAEQIIYGAPHEQRKAREKSVRGVRLFDEILKRFGDQPTNEQLRVFLREKARVDLATAKRIAVEVGKLLAKNAAHVSPSTAVRTTANEAIAESSLGELVGRLEMADYGILNIRDEISIDSAINLLNEVKKNKGWAGRGDFGESIGASTPWKRKNKSEQPPISPS